MSVEINMDVRSENLVHAHLKLLDLSFAKNTGVKLVVACSDDSGILWIALVPFQSYSGQANMELALPSTVEDAPQIV